jgi:hypothetical protein
MKNGWRKSINTPLMLSQKNILLSCVENPINIHQAMNVVAENAIVKE